ncbi:MAG: DUF2505 domain-containing protein [Cellulomonadaceae bacterium]|nr:DUF2505 domain-containing protein [Cellulomonadaceae bacterium]
MQYTKSLNYPASVKRVAAMLADPEFVRWCAQVATPEGKIEVATVVPSEDGGFTVTVRRRLPAAQIPPQFRRFVGEHIELRAAEVWGPERDGRRVGTVLQEIVGTPVVVKGTTSLEPVGDSTRQTYRGTLDIQLPPLAALMLPGLIEQVARAAMQPVDDALAAAETAGRQWLETHP